MLLTPFRVRLAEEGSKEGYKKGYIGTVIGEDIAHGENGVPTKVYLVLWNRVDEETGEESPSKQPAPSSHTAMELRSHVDPADWPSEYDDDSEYEEEFDEDDDGLDAAESSSQ